MKGVPLARHRADNSQARGRIVSDRLVLRAQLQDLNSAGNDVASYVESFSLADIREIENPVELRLVKRGMSRAGHRRLVRWFASRRRTSFSLLPKGSRVSAFGMQLLESPHDFRLVFAVSNAEPIGIGG